MMLSTWVATQSWVECEEHQAEDTNLGGTSVHDESVGDILGRLSGAFQSHWWWIDQGCEAWM